MQLTTDLPGSSVEKFEHGISVRLLPVLDTNYAFQGKGFTEVLYRVLKGLLKYYTY